MGLKPMRPCLMGQKLMEPSLMGLKHMEPSLMGLKHMEPSKLSIVLRYHLVNYDLFVKSLNEHEKFFNFRLLNDHVPSKC